MKKTEIKKLLKKSLFLDESREEKILGLVDDFNEEELKAFGEVLKSEEKSIGEIFKKLLEQEGDEGLQKIKMFVSQSETVISGESENIEHKKEEEEMSDLLDQLNDLDA